jgi:hypothetical protein
MPRLRSSAINRLRLPSFRLTRSGARKASEIIIEPSLRSDRSLLLGNGILPPETNVCKRPPKSDLTFAETDRSHTTAPNRGVSTKGRKISVREGLCGGAGRTRTSNQSVMRNLFFRPRISQVVAMDVAKPSPFIGGQIFFRAARHFTCPQSVKS